MIIMIFLFSILFLNFYVFIVLISSFKTDFIRRRFYQKNKKIFRNRHFDSEPEFASSLKQIR